MSTHRKKWLDLNEAAQVLGVHFSTLRRWADAGQIACIRTPGGRRRFSIEDLEQFLENLRQPFHVSSSTPAVANAALTVARQHVRELERQPGWFSHLTPEQRQFFRYTGQRLFGLLLQYNSRETGGETFLEEGKKMAQGYGQMCMQANMSLVETVRAFMFFRRSILETIHETGMLGGPHDAEGLRLYSRASEFFDVLLLSTVEHYGEKP